MQSSPARPSAAPGAATILLAPLVSALALTACGGGNGSGGSSGSAGTGATAGASGQASAGNVATTGASGNASAGSSGGALPAPYAGLCTKYGLACMTTSNPPNMVGTYTGNGTTTESSSPTWTVGSTNTFVTTVTSQTGGTIAGSFALGSTSLDVTDGNIRGSGNDFTIYGTGSSTSNGCTVTAAVVIVGTLSSGSVTGNDGLLVLSTSGSGCAPADGGDAGTDTPAANTGASFSFTATRGTGSDGGLDGAAADGASDGGLDGG